MPEVQGRSGSQSCPDCWFACVGNSGHPGAGEGKPRGHKSHGGILLFYFQPCFLRHEGLQIRCISEAYLVNISLLIRAEQKPSNLLRSIHQEPYLPMSQFGSWQLPLGASHHQLPISPLCAFPQSPCGHRLLATSVTASALHAGAAGPCCCTLCSQPASSWAAFVLWCHSPSSASPPHTYGAWDTARATARAEHTDSAWPQERRTFLFFYGILMKLGYRNAVSSI